MVMLINKLLMKYPDILASDSHKLYEKYIGELVDALKQCEFEQPDATATNYCGFCSEYKYHGDKYNGHRDDCELNNLLKDWI